MLILLKFLYKNNKNIHKVWTHLCPNPKLAIQTKGLNVITYRFFYIFLRMKGSTKVSSLRLLQSGPPLPPPLFPPFSPSPEMIIGVIGIVKLLIAAGCSPAKKQKLFIETKEQHTYCLISHT